MSKINRKIIELNEFIEKGYYGATAVTLNSDKVMQFINICISGEVRLRERDVFYIESIIKASKVLYDINWTRTGFLYRTIPDYSYDRLIDLIIKHKGEEPFQSHIPVGMRSETHDYPELVGTLDKAYTVEDISDKMSIEKFLERIDVQMLQGRSSNKYHVTVMKKYDGSSISVTFKRVGNRKLVPVKATSRGDFDGNKGVDMTNLVKGRPMVICPRWIPLTVDQLGIQYEAIVNEDGRKRLSEITGVNYKTRRAAIAAAIKRVINEPNEKIRNEINECIILVPINIDEETVTRIGEGWYPAMSKVVDLFTYGKQFETMLYSYSAPTLQGLLFTLKEVVKYHEMTRQNLSYATDGLVISWINEIDRLQLGRNNNKNRWQIAYKFDALTNKTKVKGILTTQGKQGYLGHNILFDDIKFNGVEYDKAPVNNITRFNRLDLRIGDEVIVSYNGDVMGYIDKDDTCKPNMDGEKLKLPTHCINCGEEVVESKDMLLCINADCSGQAVGRILETIRIFNLDFFGEETASDLVDVGITTTLEFIKMDKDKLATVLKGKNLDKAWDEFKAKITAPISMAKVIDLLRIPSLRTKTAEKIIEEIGSADLLLCLKDKSLSELEERIMKVAGIDKNAGPFAEGLLSKYDELKELIASLNVVEGIDEREYAKTILISGFRENDEFSRICNEKNFKIVTSGKYDILVVTEDAVDKGKAKAARKSGKPVILLPWFLDSGGDILVPHSKEA